MKSKAKTRPTTVILTGASGFIGRHLLEDLKNDHRIFAIARRSPQESKIPVHPNVAWIRADIGNENSINRAFREIASAGGADYLIHLAAYYDFSGDENPEYQRTNIDGTRHIISLSKPLNLKLFVFVSSVAACSYPEPGKFIDEDSPADGIHIYSRTKFIGEQMTKNELDSLPACIVRLGAVFSDWCEYPPLYALMNIWLKTSWRSGLLAGKGISALPYIHVRDITIFFRRLLFHTDKVLNGKTLLACTSGSTTHRTLFDIATRGFFGKSKTPIMIPKLLVGIGMYIMSLLVSTFEKPWMWRYVDHKLDIQNSKTCKLLDWEPSPRLKIERRMPFLVERYKSEPFAWLSRNLAILKKATSRPSFCIYNALSENEDKIIGLVLEQIRQIKLFSTEKTSKKIVESEILWQIKLIYKLLITSIHTNHKLLIQNYFEVSGMNRFKAGYTANSINSILEELNQIALNELMKSKMLCECEQEIYDYISLPIKFAIDEVDLQYQQFQAYQKEGKEIPTYREEKDIATPRQLLEETIWESLVRRK